DTPHEGASTLHEPLSGGVLADPAASIDGDSALVVAHDVDGSTNNALAEPIEGGEVRQDVTDSTDGRSTGMPSSEVAVEAPGMTEDPKEGSPTVGGETTVASIRDDRESAGIDSPGTTEETRGEAQ
ncbi:unnamed protein product, partial [Laminaria digitata]